MTVFWYFRYRRRTLSISPRLLAGLQRRPVEAREEVALLGEGLGDRGARVDAVPDVGEDRAAEPGSPAARAGSRRTGRPAGPPSSSAISSWLKMRKSAILTRPFGAARPRRRARARRGGSRRRGRPAARSRRCAAFESGARTDCSATRAVGPAGLDRELGLTASSPRLLPVGALLGAGARRLLREQDQDEGVLRALLLGRADDERLVQRHGHRRAVERDRDDAALRVPA